MGASGYCCAGRDRGRTCTTTTATTCTSTVASSLRLITSNRLGGDAVFDISSALTRWSSEMVVVIVELWDVFCDDGVVGRGSFFG